jgi:PAS domain S-box-containing protein
MSLQINGHVLPDKGVYKTHNELLCFVDSIPALLASVDCNMVIQFANKPFKKWFDDIHSVPALSFPAVVGNHLFDQIQRHLGKVLVGKTASFQISIEDKKDVRYLDVTLSPEFDDLMRVKGFIFHSADVTEKLNTQRALTDYFENASIGLHWVNADGIIIWVNPAELVMLGYSEEEYVGRHISEFHKDFNIISDILNRLRNGETLGNYEAEMICKDGSTRIVSINSSALMEGGRFIHTRCFTIDVTEKKLAERAVRESEQRFKLMASMVPLTIFATDKDGNCNFLSDRWKEMTGTSPEEGHGTQWLKLLHPDDEEKIQQSWMRSLSMKKSFEAKFRLMNSAGDYKITYSYASPIFDVQDDLSGYIGIFQDVSTQEQITSSLERIVMERMEELRKRNAELKSAERTLREKNAELEEMNKELHSFAHVASHDLQEPLRKIQMYTGRVLHLEGNKFSDKGREFFSQIQVASGRMRSLIDDILAYSKTSNIEGKIESVDLNKLMEDVISELEVKIGEKKASVQNLGLPTVRVVRFQFHQLFLNILANALKFNKADVVPVIVIRSETIKGGSIQHPGVNTAMNYYHITVADNGIGFPPHFSQKIFEIFQRIHDKAKFEGTGIGLSICKKIVENHKGIMVAEGQVDQGATFHVYLPVGS